MKTKFLSILTILFVTVSAYGQAPEGFKYQAVVRDAANTILNNQAVGVQLAILQGSATGTAVYTETFAASTNAYGLVNIEIGTGTTLDDFSTIDWATGPYFVETAIDVTGGTSYTVMGTSQLMSVPYALYAKNAAASVEADPVFNGSVASGITATDTMNWNNDLVEDPDWTVNGVDQYSAVTGNVGIGTTLPNNKLDVNGKISLSQSAGDEMVIVNDDQWSHSSGLQDFGDGGDHFMVASKEGAGESAGIYGDGDHITLWSPGDGAPGQPAALLYVNDEDSYDGATDSDPFNNTALKAYLNTAGNWVAASDARRKENIEEITSVLEKLLLVNGYTYNFKLAPSEIEKGDIAPVTYGVIAQELIQQFPEIVDVAGDGSLYVSYTELIPLLIEATQEQQTIINTQAEEISELKAMLLELSQRVEKLEK